MLNGLAIYPGERDIFYREFSDGVAHTEAFLGAYMLFEVLPFDLLGCFLSSILFCYVIGVTTTVSSLFVMTWVFFCFLSTGESVAIFVSNMVDRVGFIAVVASTILTIFSASGSVVSLTIPEFYKIINYGSAIHYSTEVAAISVFQDKAFVCTQSQLNPDGSCPITSGNQILDQLSFDPNNFVRDMAVLAGLLAIYRLIAYLALKIRNFLELRAVKY